MIRTGFYNEIKDITAVDQVGYIELAENIKNGFIPAQEGADESYNGIEDPESMLHYADDVFALYRQADYVASASKDNSAEPTRQGETTE